MMGVRGQKTSRTRRGLTRRKQAKERTKEGMKKQNHTAIRVEIGEGLVQ